MQTVIEYPQTAQGILEHLKERLGDVVPEFELKAKSEIAEEINRLKREKNAVILGHNYMEPALFHSVPDYTGDSLYLSRVSAKADAKIVIFCGVRFMAETAKILNPSRKVLLPSAKGGCSLAASINADDVRALKRAYPGVPVVTYVNCYADVKAESDYCCTSGNAVEVVKALQKQGHKRIAFLPDEYLASNTAKETGMAIVVRERAGAPGTLKPAADPAAENLMIGWKGRCEVHEQFTVDDIKNARAQFPDVRVLSHPECSPDVVSHSDYAGSTTQMLKYVEQTQKGRLLLLTECSMGDNIAAKNPNREILRICSIRCPHMGEITLEETLESLKHERYVIEVPEAIRAQAHKALDRMIAIG
ncbi:MAG: quinolinate synthase NadA [Planctomycetota bacterium]|nr:quinolinate synthase NadA [Planctomycetota bacterium]